MPDAPRIIKLADGLYVRQAVDNLTWADLGGYAVVVDALEQPGLKGEVFTRLKATIGETDIRYVLNTHMHGDHTALHPAFLRRGAKIVVHELGVRSGSEYIRFKKTWEDAGEKRAVRMHWLGGCHTAEDSVVFFPDDSVLCTGDLFGWGMIPGSPSRGGLKEALLDRYARMIDFGAETVVPGHGPLATTGHLQRWTAYFTELLESVGEAKRAGKSLAEVRAGLPLPEDMRNWWRLAEWKHSYNIERICNSA